jgi:hypothetical protein
MFVLHPSSTSNRERFQMKAAVMVILTSVLLLPALGQIDVCQAYHFELLPLGDYEVTAISDAADALCEDFKPFTAGQVYAYCSEGGASGQISTTLDVSGRLSLYSFAADHIAADRSGAGTSVNGEFDIEVVADEGDIGPVNVVVEWSSLIEGTPHTDEVDTMGEIRGWLYLNSTEIFDFRTDLNEGWSGQDTLLVDPGSVFSLLKSATSRFYLGWASTGEAATVYSTADFQLVMSIGEPASGIPEPEIPNSSTWSDIKNLFR